ncbi:MAG TPA: ABC transporter ATP-binding protein [Anaerolineae bacterium]|nr:ABC transporter ATP-binding protein [Anaerolineae bacterium]
MTLSEFSVQRAWSTDRRGPMRWLWSHIRRNWIWVVGVFAGALANAGLAGVVPMLSGQAFDVLQADPSNLRPLLGIAVLIAVSQIIRGLTQIGRNFSSEVLGQRLERDSRDEVYGSLMGKSMSFHDSHATGDLMARATNDVREINLMFNPGLNLVIGSASFLIVPVVAAPRIHPALLIAPLAYLLLYVVSTWIYLRQLDPTTRAVREQFGEMNTVLAEAIDGVETVKGAAQEARETGRFRRAVDGWRRAYIWQSDVEARFYQLLLLGLVQTAALAGSLILYQAGAINIGDVVAYNGLMLLFMFPTNVGQFAYSQVSSGIASARRILEILNQETKLDENAGGFGEPMAGALVFDQVTFGYDDAPVLHEVSFRVEPGQTVAIVGQTGSGKSTVAKLVNRIYDVQQGRVLIDGVDVRDWDLAHLRRQISIIEQDIFLFSRSVADNIAFGCQQADRGEVEEAARKAQAHDFILGFRDGYDTEVGERGMTLSGGQRQRIALARAFLTEPSILILDDSTSAIDSATEDRIQRAIEEAARGRTTILITHRLSQIRWADLIVVLKGGRIAAIGSHEELLEQSEAYRNIFASYE